MGQSPEKQVFWSPEKSCHLIFSPNNTFFVTWWPKLRNISIKIGSRIYEYINSPDPNYGPTYEPSAEPSVEPSARTSTESYINTTDTTDSYSDPGWVVTWFEGNPVSWIRRSISRPKICVSLSIYEIGQIFVANICHKKHE